MIIEIHYDDGTHDQIVAPMSNDYPDLTELTRCIPGQKKKQGGAYTKTGICYLLERTLQEGTLIPLSRLYDNIHKANNHKDGREN